MKNRTTAVLLVLFAAGVGALWYLDHAEVRSRQRAEIESRYIFPGLLDVTPASVVKIEVDARDAEPIVVERREGGLWQMVKPIDAAADKDSIDTLVTNLKGVMKSLDAGTIEGDPANYELDKPTSTVKVTVQGRETPVTFDVGKVLKDRVYVRTSDPSGIEIVDSRLIGLVTRKAADWRDTRLFRAPSFQVERVTVKQKEPAETISVKRKDSHWRMTSPVVAPADDDKVEGLVAELSALRVLEGPDHFVANDVKGEKALAKYGLDSPSMTLTLTPFAGKGTEQSVFLGANVEGSPNEAYAMRSDQDDVVKLDVKRLREAIPGANGLRSPKLLDITPQRVSRIEIEAPSRHFELVRTATRWDLEAPVKQVAETASVQTLVTQLEKLRASEFLSPSASPDPRMEKVSYRVKVWERPRIAAPSQAALEVKPEQVAELTLGKHDLARKTIYGQVGGDPTILAIPDEILKELPSDAFAFRDRSILTIKGEQFAKLTVERPGQSVTVTPPGIATAKNLRSRVVAPIDAAADDQAVTGLVFTLGNLRAEGWAGDSVGDGKAFGLDAPTLRIKWYLHKGTEAPGKTSDTSGPSGVLRVGRSKRGGLSYFANIEGDPRVFLLNAATVAPLEAEMRDRTIFSFKPDAVERVTLSWPDRSLALRGHRRSPGTAPSWEPETPYDASGFDVGIMDALMKSLSNLATSRYLEYDAPLPDLAGLAPPRLAVSLKIAGDPAEKTLRIGGSRPDGTYFATNTTTRRGALFILPSDLLWKALLKPPARATDLPANVFAPEPEAAKPPQ